MIPTTLNESNGRRRAETFGNGTRVRRIGIKLMASLFLVAVAASDVLADGELYGYVSSTGTVHVTNVPAD